MQWQGIEGANAPTNARPVDLPGPYLPLLEPARYKVYHGGRGSGKSWAFAIALLMLASTKKLRILCCREYQASINESVHFTIVSMIRRMGLEPWYTWTDTSIRNTLTGSEFIFKGLKLHVNEIKSMEAVDICWIEEGAAVSKPSWTTLDPAIRAPGSEIWVSYNPLNEADIIHSEFVIKGMPEYNPDGSRYALVRQVNFDDNPYFPPDLDKLRLRHLNDPGGQDFYAHIWLGKTLQHSSAMIFRNKWEVRDFDPPPNVEFYFGLDWGFSQDPTCCTRAWIADNCLFVDYDTGGVGIDINDVPSLIAGDDKISLSQGRTPRWLNQHGFPGIPKADIWPIKADSSQPMSISYVRNAGLNVLPADKWPGSVEDGIAHLRAFDKIYIHSRCTALQVEALMYRYKTHPKNPELVLPLIVDAHNHRWDAIRYSLDGFIQARGELGIWEQLGKG